MCMEPELKHFPLLRSLIPLGEGGGGIDTLNNQQSFEICFTKLRAVD